MCDSFYSGLIAFASVVDARRRLHGEAVDGYGGGLLHIEAIHLVAHESLVAARALVVHAALVMGLRAQDAAHAVARNVGGLRVGAAADETSTLETSE